MYASLRIILALIFIVLAGTIVCGMTIYREVSRETSYRVRYGQDWQANFESEYGPVSKAHTRIGLSSFGIVAIGSLTVWLFRLLAPGNPSRRSASRPKRSKPRYRSSLERTVRARRNGLLGVYFGSIAIVAAMLLVLFRVGIFEDPENETVLGIFVFMVGYVSVISGCWWWLKAKEWNEAIVFVGAAPLVIFFIPFVRLVFFAAPQLLLVGMVMMPAILIVVVLVLPDKSGASRRSWDRD